ncbi:unnamed protein product [Adineta ricciae]|uniref:Uncharacterized protein n=1 Tax=Adineta ricciae TaxID=249248 RepID=A0A815WRV9_ADIRI|nr:unnamed protein product [Adineta ricciae]CAF1547739.1 unnamed protein product [Adineta ricciae]
MLRIKTDGEQDQGTLLIDTLKLSEQQQNSKVLVKKDVTTLHLNDRNIRSIPSLDQFPNLTSLSIDGNHLQNLDFIRTNYALAELYAGNNHISNIQGTFRQLKNLRVLHLQNNQISNLTTLAYELRHLSALEDLNLFDNSVTFVQGYKSTMLDLFPKLRVLDRRTISSIERAQAYSDCHPDRQRVANQVGFLSHIVLKQERILPKKPLLTGSKTIKKVLNENEKLEENWLNDAVRQRASQRSLTEYSQFDWSKIPTGPERRKMDAENAVTQPDVVSIFFQ